MDYKLQKIRRYFDLVKGCRWKNSNKAEDILFCHSDYKTNNTPPALSEFVPFENGGEWGTGHDSHAWFRLTVNSDDKNRYIIVETDRSGWDAANPQFIVYVDSKPLEVQVDVKDNYHIRINSNKEASDIYSYEVWLNQYLI